MNYRLIDLSHTFAPNMPVWPGDTDPQFTQKATLDNDGYNGQLIKTSLHVGTHIDAPIHMISDGRRLSEIPVERFCGRGLLIDARGKSEIDLPLLNNVPQGEIMLVCTAWSKKFGVKEYYEKFPQVTKGFAQRLVDLKIKLLGLDTPSPDFDPFEIHKLLLQKEILIIENMTNLESLIRMDDFEIFAFPIKLEADGAPVRVVAKVALP